MAKKKRRIIEEKEEEYEFTPTEFDEREFILKDVYGTKVLFVITGLAVVVGIVGALLYGLMPPPDYGWAVATAVSFIFVLIMKRLLMLLGFRVDLLDMKTMLANYLMFLMLALGICIVAINAVF